MALYQLGEHIPQIHETAHIADSADVIGQVEMAENSSVWYGVVVRADTDRIRIGRGSNIQDNSVLHTDAGIELVIGENVTVGHQCMLHGCSIGDGSLIGIGAIVLNRARIGRHCIVGAGALVTEGKEFPDYAMILGSPAKVVKTLTPEEAERFQHGAAHYVDNARRHRDGLRRIDR
ncbi:MAG: gamma carbonic anhydrase family protein [Sphaerotilus sulfidivorans]|jgi:carbonic anhydrase/acetyltransferase-like protein (isoleucine patch superfamily)|uniref:gamma carbonic anhydrase family protein n=1 Tax=Sphaerotilus sulfidivorans TaxID=639200 RepID=UPI003F364883